MDTLHPGDYLGLVLLNLFYVCTQCYLACTCIIYPFPPCLTIMLKGPLIFLLERTVPYHHLPQHFQARGFLLVCLWCQRTEHLKLKMGQCVSCLVFNAQKKILEVKHSRTNLRSKPSNGRENEVSLLIQYRLRLSIQKQTLLFHSNSPQISAAAT